MFDIGCEQHGEYRVADVVSGRGFVVSCTRGQESGPEHRSPRGSRGEWCQLSETFPFPRSFFTCLWKCIARTQRDHVTVTAESQAWFPAEEPADSEPASGLWAARAQKRLLNSVMAMSPNCATTQCFGYIWMAHATYNFLFLFLSNT